MSKIKITQVNLPDANLIAVLGAATFYQAYYEQDESLNLSNYIVDSFNPQQIASELSDPNSTFLIARLNENAVGYAKLRENSAVECVAGENTIELQRIYILPVVYGAGVGEALLLNCLKIAKSKNFDSLWLSVWQENRRALRFYEKHGFANVGTTIFVYGEQVGHNFVLKKELQALTAI